MRFHCWYEPARENTHEIQQIHVGNTVLLLQRRSKSSSTACAHNHTPSKTERRHLLISQKQNGDCKSDAFHPKREPSLTRAVLPQSWLKPNSETFKKSFYRVYLLFKYYYIRTLLRKLCYVLKTSSCSPQPSAEPAVRPWLWFWRLMRREHRNPGWIIGVLRKIKRINAFQCLLGNTEEMCIVTKLDIMRRNMYSANYGLQRRSHLGSFD